MSALFALLLAGTTGLTQHSGHSVPPATSAATAGAAPAASCTPEHAAMGHCTMPMAPPAPPKEQPSGCTPEHAAMGHCTMPAAPRAAPPKEQPSACTPEHAAMGHCTMPAPPQAPPTKDQPSACTPEHAAMGHCSMAAPTGRQSAPAQSACTPEHAAMGHCTLQASSSAGDAVADAHAGHSAAASNPPSGPPPAAAMSGPQHAADAVYNPAEMGRSREALRREHGGMPAYKVFVDRAEARFGKGADAYLMEGQAWYGGDIDKLWLKTEAEGEWGGGLEEAELQALWSHAVDPWFDLQAGVRHDARSGQDRSHLVLGIQGLAPYWWEVEGMLFLSNKGELTARAEAELDLRITQRLILQPMVELDFSLQSVPELQLGRGLSAASAGARLRYQLTPTFAPYVGVELERAFGATRRLVRKEGERPGGVSFLTGLRVWF